MPNSKAKVLSFRREQADFQHEKFKLTRLTKGYTQVAIARALGVDNSTVSRWENGGIDPLPKHIAKIYTLLSLTPKDLYVDEDEYGEKAG